MRKFFILFIFVFLVSSVAVLATDISGKWDLQFTGPMGPETWNLTIKQDGENFTAAGSHQFLGAYEGKGTLKGNEIEIVFILQGGQYTRIIKGTLEGNKATGKVTLDGKPESDFTMVKK